MEFQQDFKEYLGEVKQSILDIGFMRKEIKDIGLQRMACQYNKKHTKKILTKPLKRIKTHLELYEKLLSDLPVGSGGTPAAELAEMIIADARGNGNCTPEHTQSALERLKNLKQGIKLTLELHLDGFGYESRPESSQAIIARCIASSVCGIEDAISSIEGAIVCAPME